jgi:hypothetical protein
MSDDADSFISTAPRLEFAFAIKARVGPIQDLGQTARGHRLIIDILGGEVHGPRLSGEILPGGATFVGVAARTPDRVAIGFHQVL